MKRASSSFAHFVQLQLGVILMLSSSTVVMAAGCKTISLLSEKSGKYLRNHTIQNVTVTSKSMCKIMCYLSNTTCLSYNYHHSTGTCEINDSDEFQHPEDLIAMEGYIYTGTENGCQSKPCTGNKTCQANFAEEGGYNCLCPSGFTGPSCNTDIDECTSVTHNCGLKSTKCENTRGSFQCLQKTGTKEKPAKSCLDILKAGHSHGNGEYWIDPGNTGIPIPALCNMTTDGGGWTVVKKLVQPSNATLPSLLSETYQVIKEYNRTDVNVIPTGAAMLDIKTKMGFHQIHFYCHKVSVGRVVSIMTKNNTAGQDVVNFFTNPGMASVAPAACHSFDILPDDTSILSQNCSAWGGQEDVTLIPSRTWGAECCMGNKRIAARPFTMKFSNVFECVAFFACDNIIPRSSFNAVAPDVNDTWQISVRGFYEQLDPEIRHNLTVLLAIAFGLWR